MFGNAILPPLTFNSNEEQTGQGASMCNKQTPERGPVGGREGGGFKCFDGEPVANPKTEGKASTVGWRENSLSSY